jgi:8-oxo-dGTP pyrophosphatase MutT (NUDIX family)
MRGIHTLTWLSQRATIGAQLALIDADSVLLVKHVYKPGWHLPGGGIDPPEAPAVAAKRELFEETCYIVRSTPSLLGIFSNATIATKRDYVALFWSNDFGPPAENSRKSAEISEARWFKMKELPSATDQMCHIAVTMLIAKGR